MNSWSTDKVLALAPDAGSASAGQSLASAKKWTSLGSSDRAIWGLCQGSGKDPYQTRIDLGEPAFKCSCPSRKFPCKHGIGLLLLFANAQAGFKPAPEPGWVSEWLESRGQRAEKKAEKAKAAADAPVDLSAQAKRAAARDDRVRQGVAECRAWLDDLIHRGLAAAQADAAEECQRVAARMVDAQAPGLAAFIRRIPYTMASGAGWEVRTLDLLGRLHLLLAAAAQLSELPPRLSGDARVALGFNQSKDEVLAGPGTMDRWIVIGHTFEGDDRLITRRTWLWGTRSATAALVLDFAIERQPFDTSLLPGMAFDGEVAFYPSAAPLRALVKSRGESAAADAALAIGGQTTIAGGLERFARALGENPWLMRWPLVLPRTRLVRAADGWLLRQGDELLPLSPTFARGMHLWKLLAATGGREAIILAEWDGDTADPMGLFLDADAMLYVNLIARWAA